MDGARLKYDKIKKVTTHAIAHGSVALSLPIYRALVSSTTRTIVPHLEQFLKDESTRVGRPGINSIAIPYIRAVGVEKCVAIAVATTVNNFTHPLSHQSLSLLIARAVSYEWAILQEDPAIVQRVFSGIYAGSPRLRKEIYLRQRLTRDLGRSLQSIPQLQRLALGNMLLSFIQRTPLVELSRDNKSGYMVCASPAVRSGLAQGLKDYADSNPINLPSTKPVHSEACDLIKPQASMDDPLSHTHDDSLFHQACNHLNAVGYTINQQQLDFILELYNSPKSILFLPGHKEPELPEYLDGMDEDQQYATRIARAKVYAERRIWRNQRTKLLSSLSLLSRYRNKEVFFNVQADFRGRLYPEADIISYQGADWIRSVWQFSKGKPIETVEQGRWLYINAANCMGLSRKSFDDRVAFVTDSMDLWRQVVADPLGHTDVLKQASDPFRFIAAIREVVAYEDHGLGYISHIPVQIDASSQAIQIWAGITGTPELLEASNVIDSGTCRDIYDELGKDIYAEALQDTHDGAGHWRISGIDRKVAKKAMMVIPYGGTYLAVQGIVDEHYPDVPFTAKQWLCHRLWTDGRDILHDLVKMQEKLTQAVSQSLSDSGGTTYTWTSPAGLVVTQRYMTTKRHRIKNAIGDTLYSYRLDTDKVSIHKHARAFPANYLHSLDASLLCHAICTMNSNDVYNVMPIHDCVGVLAADVDTAKSLLSDSYVWLVSASHTLTQALCNILKVGGGDPAPCYDGSPRANLDPSGLSPYLFS